MSRNNSVSTTASTAAFSSLASAQTSLSSISSRNHVISDFNPTLILHIPPHGAFKKPRTGIDIHDITPCLPGYNHHTLTIPESVGVEDIKAVVEGRRWSEGDVGGRGDKGVGTGGVVAGSTLVLRRHSRWSSRSTILALGERQHLDSAEWRVPWDIVKPSTITIKSPGGKEKNISVWCGKQDHRAQSWAMEGGESFVWRWVKDEGGKEELVLEKEGGGMGSHRIGVFLLEVRYLDFERGDF